nr:hypothetical protein [Tanacetum cinerariifolium]
PTPSLSKSKPAWELERSNGSKMESEVLDDDNHSTAPLQGNAPTTNAASTLAPPVEPLQKKPAFQMSVHEGSTSFLTGHGEEASPLWIDYCTLD